MNEECIVINVQDLLNSFNNQQMLLQNTTAWVAESGYQLSIISRVLETMFSVFIVIFCLYAYSYCKEMLRKSGLDIFGFPIQKQKDNKE